MAFLSLESRPGDFVAARLSYGSALSAKLKNILMEIAEPRSGHAHENAVYELEHLMANLDDDIAKIVMLHADNGLSDAEIAATMGASRSKVAMILSRAREKLRNIRRGGTRRTNSGLTGGPEAKE